MKPELEEYIQKNIDQLDRAKPNPAVLGRILQDLAPAQLPVQRGILISFRTIRWAAACLSAVIVSAVTWQVTKHPAPQSLATQKVVPGNKIKQPAIDEVKSNSPMQPVDTLQHPGLNAIDKDLAERTATLGETIREKKMISFAGFNNITSAAGRINAVTAAAAGENNGNDIVNGLLDVLDKDANTNVRLAALDGLARFYRDDYTRKRLLSSLKKQTDPLVQIALIGLLTRMRESGILATLEKMVQDPGTEKTVRDCAYSSILQLHA